MSRLKGTSDDILAVVRHGGRGEPASTDLAAFGLRPEDAATIYNMGELALALLPQAVADARGFDLQRPKTFIGDEFAGAEDVSLRAQRLGITLTSIILNDVRPEEIAEMRTALDRARRGFEEKTRAVIVAAAGGSRLPEELELTRIAHAGALFVPLYSATAGQAIDTLGLYAQAPPTAAALSPR